MLAFEMSSRKLSIIRATACFHLLGSAQPAAGVAFMQRGVSIPSHFPFRARLAHCLLTRIDCVPEDSWTYWRQSSVKNESSKKS
jgi:hypothetical protein